MNRSLSAERRRKTILSVVLAFICILYILPVLAVVVNSFKLNTYVKTETLPCPPPELCRLGELHQGRYLRQLSLLEVRVLQPFHHARLHGADIGAPRWPRGTSPA